ncbi:hypothetical protein ACSVH2_10410 [Flavobacterium sp. RSB2_4_14]|uniref:hypothetical protein n=1 Tax=Flavobacterium sp. RSB2_4_14 TaxID=3447665 RepID=UPI003F3E8C88
MKFVSSIILFLFLAFLLTPTIVTLIDNKTDTSLFYSFCEEEIHKDLKLLKGTLPKHTISFLSKKVKLKKTKIFSQTESKNDNFLEEIFSPPPQFI